MPRYKQRDISNFDLVVLEKDIKESKNPKKKIKMMLDWLDKHDMLNLIGKKYLLRLNKIDFDEIWDGK